MQLGVTLSLDAVVDPVIDIRKNQTTPAEASTQTQGKVATAITPPITVASGDFFEVYIDNGGSNVGANIEGSFFWLNVLETQA